MPSSEDLKAMFAGRAPSGAQVTAHHEVYTPALITAETINKHAPDGPMKDIAIALVLTAVQLSLSAITVAEMHNPAPEPIAPSPAAPEPDPAPAEDDSQPSAADLDLVAAEDAAAEGTGD